MNISLTVSSFYWQNAIIANSVIETASVWLQYLCTLFVYEDSTLLVSSIHGNSSSKFISKIHVDRSSSKAPLVKALTVNFNLKIFYTKKFPHTDRLLRNPSSRYKKRYIWISVNVRENFSEAFSQRNEFSHHYTVSDSNSILKLKDKSRKLNWT